MSKIVKFFGERLKELRLEKGLYQWQLAKDVGYTQAAIARWEAGLQNSNIEVAVAFAQYFSVSTDYLLGLED